MIFFTEILYLISEKYWFRCRIACWLFLYNFYDKIINFKTKIKKEVEKFAKKNNLESQQDY